MITSWIETTTRSLVSSCLRQCISARCLMIASSFFFVIIINYLICANMIGLYPDKLLLQCPNCESVHVADCLDALIKAVESQVQNKKTSLLDCRSKLRNCICFRKMRFRTMLRLCVMKPIMHHIVLQFIYM